MDKTQEKTLTNRIVKPFSLLISFVHEWTKCWTKPSVNPVISRVFTFFVHHLVHFVQIGQKWGQNSRKARRIKGLRDLPTVVRVLSICPILWRFCPISVNFCPICVQDLSICPIGVQFCPMVYRDVENVSAYILQSIGACTGAENKVYDLEPKHVWNWRKRVMKYVSAYIF